MMANLGCSMQSALRQPKRQEGQSLPPRPQSPASGNPRIKSAAAHAQLFPVYDWFSESFETAALKDAKALLDELAPA